MQIDPTQAWLNAAGRYPLLPKSEIIRLAKKRDTVKAGSKKYLAIINKICKHNLRLVPNVVNKYISKRVDYTMASDVIPDLFQQGFLGLRMAAERYDGKLGYAFSTYAYCWIYQSVSRWHNAKDRKIYIPESSLREVLFVKRHGRRSNGKSGSMAAEILDCAVAAMDVSSIDRLVNTENHDEALLSDIMSDKNRIVRQFIEDDSAAKERLADLMVQCEIHPKVQDIVTSYLRKGRMDMVAAKLAIDPKTCRTLYNQAFRTMQERVKKTPAKMDEK